jgi:hypothetical protein
VLNCYVKGFSRISNFPTNFVSYNEMKYSGFMLNEFFACLAGQIMLQSSIRVEVECFNAFFVQTSFHLPIS